MRRGEIYWAVLNPRSGSEQSGKRPVVILSHDGFNLTPSWKSIIVIPLSTSSLQSKRGPTAIPLPEGSAGLKKASIALCHQITTLDRSKLTDRIGRLSADDLRRVEEGLKAAVGL
jgi:mRNA interferase MazF